MVFKYVYELYDGNDELFYLGSSNDPTTRMKAHATMYGLDTKMKIIRKEPDIEVNLINEYLSKGINLKNKEVGKHSSHLYSVGDWIVTPAFKSSNYDYK